MRCIIFVRVFPLEDSCLGKPWKLIFISLHKDCGTLNSKRIHIPIADEREDTFPPAPRANELQSPCAAWLRAVFPSLD